MVVHDKSTTICCSRCSDEYTVDGYLYAERTMRRKAAKMGWTVVDDQDICPRCNQQERHKNILWNGHFTAAQLIAFRNAGKKAMEDNQPRFTCPICGGTATVNIKGCTDRYTFVCSGCGVSFRKE